MRGRGSEKKIDRKRSLERMTSGNIGDADNQSNTRSSRLKKRRNSDSLEQKFKTSIKSEDSTCSLGEDLPVDKKCIKSTAEELYSFNADFQDTEKKFSDSIGECSSHVVNTFYNNGNSAEASARSGGRQKLLMENSSEPSDTHINLKRKMRGTRGYGRSRSRASRTVPSSSYVLEKYSCHREFSTDSVNSQNNETLNASDDIVSTGSTTDILAHRERGRSRSRGRWVYSSRALIRGRGVFKEKRIREPIEVDNNLLGFESFESNSPIESFSGYSETDKILKKKKKKHFKGLKYSFVNKKKKTKPKTMKFPDVIDSEANSDSADVDIEFPQSASAEVCFYFILSFDICSTINFQS